VNFVCRKAALLLLIDLFISLMLEWTDQLTVKKHFLQRRKKRGLNMLLLVIFGKLLYFRLVEVAFQANFSLINYCSKAEQNKTEL